ncbi:MAG: zinc-ribbon domain-containing protein [Bradymonadales bacterium]|nr:zinc-ribbon domain-containing protein [Bradymonadales bacterium]
MRIVCDSCGTKYSISDEKIRGKLFKIRCKKCSHVIVVRGIQAAGGAEGYERDVGEQPSAPGQPAGSGEMESAQEWFYVLDGQQTGPVQITDMEAQVAAGQITPDTYVWREGMEDWIHLAEVSELAHLVPVEASSSYLAAEPPEPAEAAKAWPMQEPGLVPPPVAPFSPSPDSTNLLAPTGSAAVPRPMEAKAPSVSSMGFPGSEADADYQGEDAITVVAKTQYPLSEDEYARDLFGGAGDSDMSTDPYRDQPLGGLQQPGYDLETSFGDEPTGQFGSGSPLAIRPAGVGSGGGKGLNATPPMAGLGWDSEPEDFGGQALPAGRMEGGLHKVTPASLVGARHEDSVLFSLDSLARSTTKLSQRSPREGRAGEGSGLIDIRSLAAREPSGQEPSSSPSADHFVPAVMPLGRRQSNLLLYGLIAVGIVIIAGLATAIVVVLTQDRTPPVPPGTQPTQVAAVSGAQGESAPLAIGTATAASEQSTALIVEEIPPASTREHLQAASAAATTAAGVAIKAQTTIPDVVAAAERQQQLLAQAQAQARERERAQQTDTRRETESSRTSRSSDRTREVERRTDDRESSASRGGDAVDDALQRIRTRTAPAAESSSETSRRTEPESTEEEESESTSSGQLPERLTTNAVRQTIRRYSRRLSDCRREANLPADEVLRVDVTMTVHGTGRVASAAGDSNSPGAQCVVSVVRDMRFPEFSGAPMDFTYPFRIR